MTTPDAGKLDPAEVARMYVEHADEIRRFLIGVLRDPHLAHDALQTVFAKAAEKGHVAREESRKGWLFRVAYNEAMLIRRREATGDRILRQAVWSRDVFAAPADESVMRLEVVQAVREAMAELPEEQRRIVHLRIYDDKTFAEIAKELDIPLGTALGRMRAALEKMRARLKP